ncbi:MAG: M48 family metallopeptidase [Bacteroidota bacterium]|nr:M48 family metallopeptidase [Bacteroidota bacterium]
MKKIEIKTIGVLLGAIFLSLLIVECSTVPLTGRRQLSLVPESEMVSMSLTGYKSFIDTNKVINDANALLVKKVGKNLSKAVEKYLTDNGFSSRVADFQWEFNTVSNSEPNAWCMPGGKVCFYSGIFPYTKNEAGIAVVMGHEIAHAVARHGSERMSDGMLVQFGGVALSTAISQKPQQVQNLYMTAFGVGSQYGVVLPFSRKQEYEADKMGLIFMAIAGYNPSEAINFWERMSQKGGSSVPEFMSTHPVDANRIASLKQLLPTAMQYYKKDIRK